MDKLEGLLSVNTVLLALFLVIISFGIRALCESIWPTLSNKTPVSVAQRVWEEFILPFTPPVLGAAFSFFYRAYPFPSVAVGSDGSRIIFGVVVGWFASSIYRGVGFFVKKKWDVDVPGLDGAVLVARKEVTTVEKATVTIEAKKE